MTSMRLANDLTPRLQEPLNAKVTPNPSEVNMPKTSTQHRTFSACHGDSVLDFYLAGNTLIPQ